MTSASSSSVSASWRLMERPNGPRARATPSPTARRADLIELAAPAPSLADTVAAAHEFIFGPLLASTRRVGKRLRPPLDDRHSARRGTYRVVYRIDDDTHTVTVLDVAHRRDAYRTSG